MLPVVSLVQQERIPTLTVAPSRETAGGRHIVRVGTLRALVPATLPASLIDPKRTEPESALLELATTLDTHQWQKLASPEGLGLPDLRPEQRNHFGELVINLPESSRLSARLQLETFVSFYYAFQDERLNQQADGIPLRTAIQAPEPLSYLPTRATAKRTEPIPNRLKPSALNYKSADLNAEVDLNGVPTVGALLARVAAATRLELHADTRLASLPVTVTGRARAGDVLELLALSVGGAFRLLDVPRHGRAWVLTDDQEGALARAGRWNDSYQAALEHRRGQQARLTSLQPQPRFVPNRAFGLPPSVLSPLAPLPNRPGEAQATVGLSALPPALAEQLRAGIRQLQDEYQSNIKFSFTTPQGVRTNPPVDPNRIKVRVGSLQLKIIAPGVGFQILMADRLARALAPETSPPEPPLPTPKRPELRDRIAVLYPKTIIEAKEAVQAAVQARLSRLWIATTETDLGPLRAALDAGKAAHLPIVAYLALTELPTSAPLDVEGSGASAAFRVPDAPETLPQLRAFLPKVARLPGLAGLVFGQTVAPGYDLAPTEGTLNRWETDHFGYTPERRLAFLRRFGVDPIDLSETFRPMLSDPLPEVIPDQWNALRAQANVALLATVYRATKQAAPSLPLWIEGRGRTWFGSWEAESPLPQFRYAKSIGEEQPATPSLDLQARRYSKTVYLSHAESDLPPSQESAPAWLTWSAFRETTNAGRFPWDGFVLNLRSLPLEKALAVLKESAL